ncbi:vWA domain-containing protein [Stenotrophomonas mori]|uniref:VWA domain-containing protein n=1 Tax=Stenotrophomonas mori TaxID=2871096 RepID=A0ABT0SCX1_9GAMM|nr:VWA domain-containing protein [Stenotrophomonas mori]MCL7713122.1 VWA domain-containing protein [Stenotrophomonas mori]
MSGGWSAWLEALPAFAWPWAWLALPLPLLMRLWPQRAAGGPALRVPWPAERVQPARAGRLRVSPRLLLPWLAWACLCASAARPQHLGDALPPLRDARQMMLAVDLSGSMSEADMRLGGRVVDRLTAAKAVLADFLDRRDGDRIGLVVFGQQAYALTPLTHDHESVRAQLRDSVVGLAGRETALGDAIALAVKRLRAQPEGQRVLVLLTDGVSNAGALEPLKAAELAVADGVRVHAIAFGGEGGFSLFGLQVGGGGEQIDEATLARIAGRTGGRFFRARDTDELAGIYGELDRLEPVHGAGPVVRPRLERYAWPLAAALLLALLAMAWPGGRR